jgi:hypothetical protein
MVLMRCLFELARACIAPVCASTGHHSPLRCPLLSPSFPRLPPSPSPSRLEGRGPALLPTYLPLLCRPALTQCPQLPLGCPLCGRGGQSMAAWSLSAMQRRGVKLVRILTGSSSSALSISGQWPDDSLPANYRPLVGWTRSAASPVTHALQVMPLPRLLPPPAPRSHRDGGKHRRCAGIVDMRCAGGPLFEPV